VLRTSLSPDGSFPRLRLGGPALAGMRRKTPALAKITYPSPQKARYPERSASRRAANRIWLTSTATPEGAFCRSIVLTELATRLAAATCAVDACGLLEISRAIARICVELPSLAAARVSQSGAFDMAHFPGDGVRDLDEDACQLDRGLADRHTMQVIGLEVPLLGQQSPPDVRS
jgi:hypothetical protein